MKHTHILTLLLAGLAAADWQFRSRPDLAVPRLNITVAANNTAPGYLFLAPFSGFVDHGVTRGPRQAAPYIYTDAGDLVWSGYTYFSIWAANFQAGRYHGEDILFAFEGDHNPNYGHGHGHVTFLDRHYDTVKEVRAGNHRLLDKHEFHIVDERTALVQIYHPVPRDLSEFASDAAQQWIIDAQFQEIDIATGDVLFEWSALDHVSPSESLLPPDDGEAGHGYNSSDAWDYFHINAVDKDANGDYIISARHTAALYKIDGRTGDIVYKFGGLPAIKPSSFSNTDNFTFAFQHHARFLSRSDDGTKEVISFYDNSAHGTENNDGNVVDYNKYSSAKIVELDTETWTAKLLFLGVAPDGVLSKSQGNTQVLANGNVLIGTGSAGSVAEFDPAGNVIFAAYLDSGVHGNRVQNYRAFRYEWTGIPREKIAVFSELTADGSTVVYVSWNGDTRTRTWKFFLVKHGKKHYLGKAPKSGFETTFYVDTDVDTVLAEAYDDEGELLGESSSSRTVAQVVPAKQRAPDAKAVAESYFSWKLANSLWS